MKLQEFAVALSEKDREDAVKEVSLHIKTVFPKDIHFLFILFTPHYSPSQIIKAVYLTLKPQKMIGLQAPLLIYGERVIEKGIVACCINKASITSKEVLIKTQESQDIEKLLRFSFQKPPGENFFFFSFLPPSLNASVYLNAVRLALGRAVGLLGAGFSTRYASHFYTILDKTTNDCAVNIGLEGLSAYTVRLGGYMPLGKTFTITKAVPEKSLVMEINNQPAVMLFKHYLENKFDLFMKNRLFTLYPFGIKTEEGWQLVSVADSLPDGSLACVGEIKEGACGHLMLLDPELIDQDIRRKLKGPALGWEGLAFIINSLLRRSILKTDAGRELRTMKETLGKSVKMIGIYADYTLAPEAQSTSISIDSGNVLFSLWQ